jgi:hypothetical protein
LVRVMTMAATVTQNIEHAHSEFTMDLSRNSDPTLLQQIHLAVQSTISEINATRDSALGAIGAEMSHLETARVKVATALTDSQHIVDSLKTVSKAMDAKNETWNSMLAAATASRQLLDTNIQTLSDRLQALPSTETIDDIVSTCNK